MINRTSTAVAVTLKEKSHPNASNIRLTGKAHYFSVISGLEKPGNPFNYEKEREMHSKRTSVATTTLGGFKNMK